MRFYRNACVDLTVLQKDQIIESISIPRTHAEKQARDIVHLDMELSAMSTGVYLDSFSESEDNLKSKENLVYYFYSTRKVGNSCVTYEQTVSANSPPTEGESKFFASS